MSLGRDDLEPGRGGTYSHSQQAPRCFFPAGNAVAHRPATDSRGGRAERWQELCSRELCWQVSCGFGWDATAMLQAV